MKHVGRIRIAPEFLLDLLCFDPTTHTIVVLELARDGRTLWLDVEGPDMPAMTEDGFTQFVTPEYKRKDWERVTPPTTGA